MTSSQARSWWDEYNGNLFSAVENGWRGYVPLLSGDMCDLLADVDNVFAVTGADTPGWPNPYKDGQVPNEEAYERVTDPEKFLIVVARAQAWTKVLLDRGWAREASETRWAFRPLDAGGAGTILAPTAAGAVPLVLTTHTPVDSEHIFTVTVAAGDPAVSLASIPDCGCDACDRGSTELIKDMDQWVLSVVDGSLEVHLTEHDYSVRTSFINQAGDVRSIDEPTSFRAAPWPPKWRSRLLDAPGHDSGDIGSDSGA
ncbi:DUF6226 family protein [Rhodococcus sp. ABRD24]|uniref:DUF6226 family protein n=1 Tax=Rhodococcus sp. ABRD24 TaxID=2507582 RepID=UPI001A954B25|nr:DUF6226 family protein [Rhodococcus sp. ABRD24]